MKSRRKNSVRWIMLAGFPSALFAFYIHFGLFPGNARLYAIEKIGSFTGKHVQFDKALYLPLEGLSLHNLKVTEKDGRAIFSCKRFSINVQLLPFFREKKIIVNRLVLDSPLVDYVLDPVQKEPPPTPVKTVISGQINVPLAGDKHPPRFEQVAGGLDSFSPENVFLQEIQIQGGLVTVRKNVNSPIVEIIHDIHLRMGFQKPPILAFQGSLKLGQTALVSVRLEGRWNLKKAEYEFNFESTAKAIPDWLVSYQKNNFLILREGGWYLKTRLKSDGETQGLFHAQARLNNAEIFFHETRYAGALNADAKGIFDFNAKTFQYYQGSLNLIDVNVTNLSPTISQLDDLKGQIYFEPDLLTVESIRGEYKDLPFEASGTIRSFKELIVDGQIRSNLTLEQTLSMIPEEQKKWLKDFDILGNCQAVTTLGGSLKKSSAISANYRLLIENASLSGKDKKIQLTNLSTELRMDASGTKISNARFDGFKQNCLLNAFIPKSSEGVGTLKFETNWLHLEADYRLVPEKLLIQEARLDAKGIAAHFTGELTDWQRLRLDIQGKAEFDLETAPALLPQEDSSLKTLGLAGQVNGPFTLSGHWDNPLHWDFKMDGLGQPILLNKTFRIHPAEIQIRMKNGLFHIPYIHGNAYQGTLSASAVLDFTKPGISFETRLYGNGVDLTMLGKDLSPVQKDLAGTAIFQIALHGFLKSPETYHGQGALSITKGWLWQSSLFKPMGNLPFVKVEGLDLVTFQDLSATFDIHDKQIWTEDLAIFGDAVDLSLSGSMGFDQSLDFGMNIRYSEDVMRGATASGGLVPFVVQEAGEFISQYRVRGTLKSPAYEKQALPVGNVIGKKIGKLFQAFS